MTCKDCFNYENCSKKFEAISQKINGIEEYDSFHNWDNVEELCKLFKDKSKIVELPCKVGTRVFEVRSYYDCKTDAYCECQNFGFRGEKACLCCENNTRKNAISASYFNLKMRDRIGKTVFLTKEEAEARLKELQNG